MPKTLVGYVADEDLPVREGDYVRILKGTKIRTTNPSVGKRTAKKTYTVRVDHTLNGNDAFGPYPVSNPSVRWVGAGKYWYEADINDVELVADGEVR